ncbi:MAG: cytochrome c1 [Alphaproteobacteria bacterium]|jgi:ubiquinol-cytochrome c reductase cytochrome c1 subunit|nr:cytochrome c1 [Alphaproteobacteria bacterium]MBN8523344.1 cytochrome c1 [Rickettsiales bacterium]
MYNRVIIPLLILFSSFGAIADATAKKPLQLVWPFEGIFGTFDRQAAQRGAQVYLEVCSTCHSNHNLYYRNLKDIGFSEAEIKQLAQKYTVKDGPNAEGEMFDRPALPSDRFVSPYPNEEAARAANNGAYPVDLSLIIKARQDGPNYVFSLLSGYQDAPADVKLMPGLYYNPYFEGGQIAMPPPLTEGQVTFSDGTPATVEQMAKDVVVFLQWAAEPEMEHRKSMGLKVMIFLLVFTVFFYTAKKKIWKNISR